MGDRFQRYAAQRFTADDFALLTDEEEQVLLMRRKQTPLSVANQLHMSVESVHRRQRSIISKLG